MRIAQFLNMFKLQFKHKKKVFKFRYVKKLDKVIKIFFKYNFIKLIKMRGGFLYIYINNKSKLYFSEMKIHYRLTCRKKITLETLKRLNLRNLNGLTILSTNKGYLSIQEAVKVHVGGTYFIKIT